MVASQRGSWGGRRHDQGRVVIAGSNFAPATIHHLLRDRTTYCELGSQYFDERDRQATERHLVRRFEVLCNRVTTEPKERPL